MGKLELYIPVGRERLRCGYTTGTCAAAAAAGAAALLLEGAALPAVHIDTPAGVRVEAELLEHAAGDGWAACAVRKDGGDDPDVTDGALICARVERSTEPGIAIDGGQGVGRVTRPGLDQPVGEAAINSTPRRMIHEQLEAAAARAGYAGGLRAVISVPTGEALAGRTFNPRLGIEGGISILGTSGIVRPMSEAALLDSLYLEMDQQKAAGARDIVVTPGVSSFSGAAAALCAEYTLPEVSQSVIITRMAGRTPVPEGEELRKMASHGCTMVLFLSTGLLEDVEQELAAGGYAPDTPAAIVYKATWPEQRVYRCTVSTLAKTARENQVTKTALITIGHFLGDDYERSKLYDPTFTHEFREASK